MGIKGTIAWKFLAKKINANFIRGFVSCIIDYLAKMYEDPDKIYEEEKKIFKHTGEIIYLRYLQATGRPARSIKDLPSAFNLGFKFFTGKAFDRTNLEERGKDIYITYEIKDCPICKGVKTSVPVPFCVIFAGIFEWIEEQRLQDWNAESVTCDEVKCRNRGDDRCEFRAHIRLK